MAVERAAMNARYLIAVCEDDGRERYFSFRFKFKVFIGTIADKHMSTIQFYWVDVFALTKEYIPKIMNT